MRETSNNPRENDLIHIILSLILLLMVRSPDFRDGHFLSSFFVNGCKGLYIKIVARTSTRRGWMRATGDGEGELNGDGVCAVVQPFDNEGRRGEERRAPDERVYTFCVYIRGSVTG